MCNTSRCHISAESQINHEYAEEIDRLFADRERGSIFGQTSSTDLVFVGKFELFDCVPCVFQRIHRFMTGPELGFYFGSANRGDVPEYQIVYMPVLMARSAQRTEESDSVEDDPIDYGFNAFGRYFYM